MKASDWRIRVIQSLLSSAPISETSVDDVWSQVRNTSSSPESIRAITALVTARADKGRGCWFAIG